MILLWDFRKSKVVTLLGVLRPSMSFSFSFGASDEVYLGGYWPGDPCSLPACRLGKSFKAQFFDAMVPVIF